MKKDVMLKAWELFRKGYSEVFGECLKGAWTLIKKVRKFYIQGKIVAFEVLDNKMVKDRAFKHTVNRDNLLPNCTYPRDKKGEMTYSLRTWIKPGIARIYADEFVDGIFFDKSYVQTRI
ncbi:hypothetical protein [Fusobacterium mortiferum]|uniref:Uncharacterized protein n=1 Tax=Fusobacterium mortiferum TaxID=850 RepID=A0ABS2G442_FUSMR|nr:hypothetical protein [Fusobacterium mortiferum]MBM6876204.1 hypothetical protein [Fusobacterium mortiferum]